MYKAMYGVGFALMMLLNLFQYKLYNTTRRRAVCYTVITYVYGVLGAMLMGKLYTTICAAKNLFDYSRVAIFGAVMFTPLLLLLTAQIEKLINKHKKTEHKKNKHGKLIKNHTTKVSLRDTMDLLTPGIFIILACAKFGCHFGGCCFGVEWSWGVHSEIINTTVFPVQLFECATMCIIIISCFFIKRTKFFRRGMAFPLTAAIYCCARFCWEFMRYYTDELRHLILGFTMWQFCCIIVFTASVISIIILYKTQPSEPLPAIGSRKNVI